jgi:hypothetical protein
LAPLFALSLPVSSSDAEEFLGELDSHCREVRDRRDRLAGGGLRVQLQLRARLGLRVGVGVGALDLRLVRMTWRPPCSSSAAKTRSCSAPALPNRSHCAIAALPPPSAKPLSALPTASYCAAGSSCLNSLTLIPMAFSAAPTALVSSSTPTRFFESLLSAVPMLSTLTPAVAAATANDAMSSAAAPVLSERSWKLPAQS